MRIMLKLNIIVIYLLFLFSKIAIADETIESTTFSCKILRHLQILRTVITEFDKFEFGFGSWRASDRFPERTWKPSVTCVLDVSSITYRTLSTNGTMVAVLHVRWGRLFICRLQIHTFWPIGSSGRCSLIHTEMTYSSSQALSAS